MKRFVVAALALSALAVPALAQPTPQTAPSTAARPPAPSTPAPAAAPAQGPAQGAMIDINSASKDELQTLAGRAGQGRGHPERASLQGQGRTAPQEHHPAERIREHQGKDRRAAELRSGSGARTGAARARTEGSRLQLTTYETTSKPRTQPANAIPLAQTVSRSSGAILPAPSMFVVAGL